MLQKQIFIPRLALQNIQRQGSDVSHNSSFQTPVQSNIHSLNKTLGDGQSMGQPQIIQIPKNIKVLSSKRGQNDFEGSGQQMMIKSSQITKTLQGQELLELYERLDTYKRLVHEVKKALGDSMMHDSKMIDHILNLKKRQRDAADES